MGADSILLNDETALDTRLRQSWPCAFGSYRAREDHSMTKAEQVAALYATGLGHSVIAKQLHMSTRTVRKHLIAQGEHIRTKSEAASIRTKLGLLRRKSKKRGGYCICCEQRLATCGITYENGEGIPANWNEDGLCWMCIEEGWEPDGNGGWKAR